MIKKYLFNGFISSIIILSMSALLFFAFVLFGNTLSKVGLFVFTTCSFLIMFLVMFLTGRYVLKDLGANLKNIFSILWLQIVIAFLIVSLGGDYTTLLMFFTIFFTIIAPPSVLDNSILCMIISITLSLAMLLFLCIGLAMKRKNHLEN